MHSWHFEIDSFQVARLALLWETGTLHLDINIQEYSGLNLKGKLFNMAVLVDWAVAQWESTCLDCRRPWVWSLASEEVKTNTNNKPEWCLSTCPISIRPFCTLHILTTQITYFYHRLQLCDSGYAELLMVGPSLFSQTSIPQPKQMSNITSLWSPSSIPKYNEASLCSQWVWTDSFDSTCHTEYSLYF